MKKMLCVLFVLILSLPVVAMAEINWQDMSVEEIQAEINKARAEILTREIKFDEKGTVLLDYDGVVMSITKVEVEKYYDGTHNLKLYFTVVNNTDHYITFQTGDVYLNGWALDGFFTVTLDTGMKAREEPRFYKVDTLADVSSYEDLEELKMELVFFDGRPNCECTIYFKQGSIVIK